MFRSRSHYNESVIKRDRLGHRAAMKHGASRVRGLANAWLTIWLVAGAACVTPVTIGAGDEPDAAVNSGGAGGSDAAAPASRVSEEEYLEQLAAAWCDNLEPCCTALGNPYNRERCHAYVIAGVRNQVPEAYRNRFSYDPEAAARCIEQTRQFTSSCQAPEGDPDCTVVYTGNTRPGEPCENWYECARPPGGTASCDVAGSNVCHATTRGRAGDLCGSTCTQWPEVRDCVGFSRSGEFILADCYTNDGLYCSIAGCQPLLGLGQACDSDEACAPDGRCNGVCVPRGQLGEPCSMSTCADTLYCDENTATCAKVKAPGEPCITGPSNGECGRGFCNIGACANRYPFPDIELCNGY
jgi:hypothetical protein